ncbi:DUF5337 domain-containing protein [Mameliella sediminis]|uniref:DUF5337 domain-containing protein n=1 Tax=Mameliella sediminis TaxID=2836866 RepID=UPI001C46A7C6|nr:DUF5337 domain-containing protein [Mameliella sediminis]MBY6115510.1 DUF5337 domain-containing protein [Antarctobacter heliothermus]MBY6145757.1 DUF5337 domain-containing protein [Mameliella alba]MBV7393520.1 DUF5337 domain-containing protein [Mameliella sediminis]MBY6161080.1 DUF5337 domain-containing protein [Mameliella alba]MBY6169550.1 DUF5337 domain-containing protein [Mameliella alba]
MAGDQEFNRRGRVIALVIAGTGLGWVVANALGAALDLSQRWRALFDLAALGGFVWAMWMLYGLWRDRQEHKD